MQPLTRGTICYPVRVNEVLLGFKKRGREVGVWNGFGGKVEQGETFEEAARRELKEEADIEAIDMTLVTLVRYLSPHPHWNWDVQVFITREWVGTPSETEEMRPAWYRLAALP